MSKERSDRKTRLNMRTYVIKKVFGCDHCPNGKFHSDGLRIWCTKCKKPKSVTKKILEKYKPKNKK